MSIKTIATAFSTCALILATTSISAAFGAKNPTRIEEFVGGNMMFETLHETGHMIVNHYGLGIFGDEEDVADNFATATMLRFSHDFMRKSLIHVVTTNLAYGEFEPIDQARLSSPYPLYSQIAYKMICQLAGYDMETYGGLIEYSDMPLENLVGCDNRIAATLDSWQYFFEMQAPPKNHENEIDIIYDQPQKTNKRALEQLKTNHTLEDVRWILNYMYKLEKPVTIHAKNCGDEQYHDFVPHQVNICYELVENYIQLIED